MQVKQIGVLGASFNPPTKGHTDVILQVAPYFDEILLIPSISHPFNKTLAPLRHRLAMMELLVENFSDKTIKQKLNILEIESKIQSSPSAPIYTYDVLSKLEQIYHENNKKPFQLSFILGPDNRKQEVWEKFYRFSEIEKKWSLFVAEERIPIHSTKVREIIAVYDHDPSTLLPVLETFVEKPIAEYILKKKLYTKR